jgi:hypothetical protein
MTTDDAADDDQPDARARGAGVAMQALRRMKHPAGVGHVEASSVVPHKKRCLTLGAIPGARFDAGWRLPGSELPRVGQQKAQYDPREIGIRVGPQSILHGNGHLALRLSALQRLQQLAYKGAELDRLRAQFGARYPVQEQQVLD